MNLGGHRKPLKRFGGCEMRLITWLKPGENETKESMSPRSRVLTPSLQGITLSGLTNECFVYFPGANLARSASSLIK